MAFQKKGLRGKHRQTAKVGIYISTAVAVCKVAKVPYGENFVKIFAGLGSCRRLVAATA